MARETLVPRLYGSEVEYGMTLKKVFLASYENNRKTVSLPKYKPPGIIFLNDYLENGARLYVDTGTHVEYATPTCHTISELIKHEFAGERLVWEAYGDGRSVVDVFNKRANNHNIDPAFSTSGAHENYSVLEPTYRNDLSTHLATRTAYIGAGYSRENEYGIGQKTEHIGLDKKNFYRIKDEDNHEGESLVRLEVVSGDANISPWAIGMKFGTTSLVLRLFEHNKDLSDLSLADPYMSARLVAQSPEGMSKPLELKSGKKVSALNIQEELVNRAFLLSQEIELPQEEQEIIPKWKKILDSLERYTKTGDHEPILEQIDWYAKKQIIDKATERRGDLTMGQKMMLDFKYGEIPGGFGIRLRDSKFASHMPEDEEIEKARTTPPEGRSQILGSVVKKLALKHGLTSIVNWGYIVQNDRHSLGPVEAKYTDEQIEKKAEDIANKLKRR